VELSLNSSKPNGQTLMNGMSSEDLIAKAAEFAKKAEEKLAAGGEEANAPPPKPVKASTAPSNATPAPKTEPGMKINDSIRCWYYMNPIFQLINQSQCPAQLFLGPHGA